MDKVCTKCKLSKSSEDYHKQTNSKDGYSNWCKVCGYDNLKIWRKKNPDKIKKNAKNFRINNPKAYYNSQYKSKYGISIEEYNRLFDIQKGQCKICKIDSKELPRKLAVDHNHVTGKVRGLLCGNCNVAIGNLKESVIIIKEALNYLAENN